MGFREELRKWVPNLSFGVWIQTVPLLIVFCLLWVTATHSLTLFPNTFKFWEYVIYGWMYGLLGYWIGMVICVRYLRARWLAVLFASFYLFLYAVNCAFLHSAGVVLVHYYLEIADTTAWMDYFTPWMWMLVAVFLFCAGLASWLVWRYAPMLQKVHVRSLLLLSFLLWGSLQLSRHNYIHPSAVITRAVGQRPTGKWQVTQTETLRTVADNPLLILERAVFTRTHPLQLRPDSDLAKMSETIQQWRLPLGPRHYPKLGLKPFNHIVVFATESMSLDFLSPYNRSLPPDISPFFSSDEIKQTMYVDYKTIALPSQPGLSVEYNSHPNVSGLLAGSFDLSLAKLLDANGYDTYLLTAGSDTFLNDKAFFIKMGFKHVIGLEEWEQDAKLQPFVEGRGLMDRVLYDQVLKLLAENRDRKIYIHVVNMDTHGPLPRADYGSLDYPPTPPDIQKCVLNNDSDAAAILTGIFRYDHDIGLTINRMKEMGLLTDDTLVVLTADHNFPPTKALRDIPGYPGTFLCRIPMAFLSGQPLPQPWHNKPSSQLDFAPTLAHLLNLTIPEGWWGDSLLTTNSVSPYIVQFNDKLSFGTEPNAISSSLLMDRPENESQHNLLDLYQTLYVPSMPSTR